MIAARLGAILLICLFTVPSAFAKAPKCTAKVSPGGDIQKALDALPADGSSQTVCLAAGTFDLGDMIHVERDHVTLRGMGPKTVLHQRDGLADPVIVIGLYKTEVPEHPIQDVTLENMRIIGGNADQEFNSQLRYLSNSAVVVRRGQNITLRDLQVSSCRSACLLTEHETRGVLIQGNQVEGADWDGVSFNRSYEITMTGNTVRKNNAAGITAEHLESSVISDNLIEDNGSHGVYLSDSLHNRFENNTVRNNTLAGVYLTCSIRYREPDPVMCWDNSMSQDNVFAGNQFAGNKYGYQSGEDKAANCALPEWKPNIWTHNTSDAPNLDPHPELYGTCTRPE